ncbi:Mitochondrial division protein 1 [Balamuthia mandrillaris]
MGTACSNVSSSYFSVLPPEINIHILSFLDAKELLEVALVNKEWNRLALDEALWRRLCDRRWKELREGRRLKFSKHKRQKMVPLKRSESWKDVFAHRTRVDKNWSTGNYSRVVTLRGHEGQVCCCQYDEEKIVSGSFDSSIKVWDIRNLDTEEEVSAVMTLKKKETNAAHTDRVLCLMFEDNTLVTGGRDETIKIWDLETGTCVNTLSGHSDNVWYLQFDHEKIISGSADKTIRHWDIRTGKCYKTLIGHDRGLSCLHFENEENLLMSGSADQTIRLWDLRTDQCRQILEGHEEAVYCLYYYNRKLISGGEDKTARIWDIDSGKCTSTISDETCKDKHTGAIYCMQFDDARLVTGSFDHTIKVWDMNTEECLCTLGKDLGDEDDFHTNTVRCIQFDDHKMVSASADRTIKLWDMR